MVQVLKRSLNDDKEDNDPPPAYEQTLALRNKKPKVDQLSVRLRATANDAILVSVQPPVAPPLHNANHVPCAIVLLFQHLPLLSSSCSHNVLYLIFSPLFF